MIFADEADFWNDAEQNEMLDTAERYIGKSNPWIVLCSTPNKPSGLFASIKEQDENVCIYKRLYLDYTVGLNKIYSLQEIENAKRSGSFEREYNLKFLGKIGNVFHERDIIAAVEKGKLYDPDSDHILNYFSSRSLGCDPGYGSSAFGIVCTQWQDNHIQILHAKEYHKPDFNEMISVVYGLMSKYDIDKVYIDGSAVSFIRSLKIRIGEDPDYDAVISSYRSRSKYDKDGWKEHMKIIPVNFGTEHKELLGHTKMILEQDDPRRIAINPKFSELITSLRTAYEDNGTLVKDQTLYDDLFDSLRLSLKFYEFTEE